MDEITFARVMDPGRGPFCALTKQGVAVDAPPTRREPIVDRTRNPRGVRHPFKTFEDSQPVKERRRYNEWVKRQGK